jgi:hypothetical protein
MPAKVEPTSLLPGLSPAAGKPLIARFDGGQLSSDGGLLALGEVEQRLGLAERLATCIDDPRASERVRHGLADILRFRMLMNAAGYEDGNDADSLDFPPWSGGVRSERHAAARMVIPSMLARASAGVR